MESREPKKKPELALLASTAEPGSESQVADTDTHDPDDFFKSAHWQVAQLSPTLRSL